MDTETYRTKLKTQDYESLFDVKVRIFQKISFNMLVLEKKINEKLSQKLPMFWVNFCGHFLGWTDILKYTFWNISNYTEPQSLELSNVYCLKGNENTSVLHQFGQNCMLLERKNCKGKDPFNLYKEKCSEYTYVSKSKDFVFLDFPISMSF